MYLNTAQLWLMHLKYIYPVEISDAKLHINLVNARA